MVGFLKGWWIHCRRYFIAGLAEEEATSKTAIAAIVYSLISTCKNAGIEPRIWMEDVQRKIPYYLRDGKDLSELLPRHWAKLGTNRTDSDTNKD